MDDNNSKCHAVFLRHLVFLAYVPTFDVSIAVCLLRNCAASESVQCTCDISTMADCNINWFKSKYWSFYLQGRQNFKVSIVYNMVVCLNLPHSLILPPPVTAKHWTVIFVAMRSARIRDVNSALSADPLCSDECHFTSLYSTRQCETAIGIRHCPLCNRLQMLQSAFSRYLLHAAATK